jgi:NADH/NAD ratio-sensing transcriptional regulator Rex
LLGQSPVTAVLNFSSFELDVNPQITVFSFNLQVKLDVVSFYVHNRGIPPLPENSLL